MPEKEIQTKLEHKKCPVCDEIHTFECGILLSKEPMLPSEEPVVTGLGLCEKHSKFFEEGYVALIEVSNDTSADTLSVGAAERTGRVGFLNREAVVELIAPDLEEETPLIYCEEGVLDALTKLRDVQENSSTVVH